MKMPNGTMTFSNCPRLGASTAFALAGGGNPRLGATAVALDRIEDALDGVAEAHG